LTPLFGGGLIKKKERKKWYVKANFPWFLKTKCFSRKTLDEKFMSSSTEKFIFKKESSVRKKNIVVQRMMYRFAG
jgi:hypothetical protein